MKAQSAWIPDASKAFCRTCVDSTAAQASTANGAARNLRSAFAQHAANASSPGVGGRSNQQANASRRLKPGDMRDDTLDDIWVESMQNAPSGDLIACMQWEREGMLIWFNKNALDKKALALDDDDVHRARKELWLSHIARNIHSSGLNALVKQFITPGDNSPTQEVFRGILQNKFMLEVAAGKHFNYEQTVMVQTSQLIQAMVALEFYFTNLSKIANLNLVTELGEILHLPAAESLHMITLRLDKLTDPLAKAYLTSWTT